MSTNEGNVNGKTEKELNELKDEYMNTLKGEDKKEYLENRMEEIEEQKYMKLVWISMYVSFWLLSCVLLYTYNAKRSATLEYNRVMTQLNTNKLNEQIRKYDKKCKEYVNLAYPSKVMNEDNEIDTTGLSKIKHEMYIELIKTIEVYDKCNYIKLNTDGSPFPISEIMISSLLLLLILAIIIVSNLTNNPFSKVTYDKEIREIEDMVKSKIEDGVEMSPEMKNKLNQLLRERDLNRSKTPVAQQPQQANTMKPPPQVSNAQAPQQVSTNKANTPQAETTNTLEAQQPQAETTNTQQVSPQAQQPQAKTTNAQTPPQNPQAQAETTNPQVSPQNPPPQVSNAKTEKKGGSKNKMSGGTADLQRTLELLQNREIEIATRISMLKSNATFNYSSLSFCIIIFSFYISYKMIMSSVYFNDNLFSGAAFMKSRCYSN